MRKKTPFVLKKPLNHVAFIMDGNGRWAKLRGLPRHLGHKEACNRIREIFDTCRDYGIKVMSFYAFSTENWNRPQDEIDHLMDYLEEFFAREIDYICSQKARIMISGDLSRIREQTRKVCYEAIDRTKDYQDFVINICLNYGSRDELVRATKAIVKACASGEMNVDDITEQTISDHLFTKGLPDVDLMIRTSGEQRLSNYLLWQNAYAEFVFTKVKWPDFRREQLIDCFKEFQNRNRRYGGLKNE